MRVHVSMLVVALTLVTPVAHAATNCVAPLGRRPDNGVHASWGGMGSSRWVAIHWTAKADVPNARLLEFLEDLFAEDPEAVVRSTIPEQDSHGQPVHTSNRKLGMLARVRSWGDRSQVRVQEGTLPELTSYEVQSPKFGKLGLSYLAKGGENALGIRVRSRLLREEKFLEAVSRLLAETAQVPISVEAAKAQVSDEISRT